MVSIAVCVALLSTLLPAPQASAGINWVHGTWDDALNEAKSTHKPIMALFFDPTCGPCILFDSTLSAPEIVAYSAKFVCLKLDEDDPANKALASRFKAVGTPITIFFDWKGEESDRVLGNASPAGLLADMERIRSGRGTVPDLLAREPSHRNDVEFNAVLGTKLSHRGDPHARIYLERVLALDSTNVHGKSDDALWALSKVARRDSDLAGSAELLERLTQSYPGSELAQDAYFALATCYSKLGQNDHAVATLEAAVAKDPENPMRLNELAWSLAEWKIHLDRALVAASKAVELSKEDPGILDTLAEVYFVRGEHTLAVATEKKVVEKQPNDPQARDRLSKFEAAARAAQGK